MINLQNILAEKKVTALEKDKPSKISLEKEITVFITRSIIIIKMRNCRFISL